MQVQPPCQTQGAAATREDFVVAVVKVVLARGIAPALRKSPGEAVGETPLSALTQKQKCYSSSKKSTEHGSFDEWLIIWGTWNSSERMYYNGSADTHTSPQQSSRLDLQHKYQWQCSKVVKAYVPAAVCIVGKLQPRQGVTSNKDHGTHCRLVN